MVSTPKPPKVANVPRHVAIVMDGNGRWAKKRGLPRTAGHEAGEAASAMMKKIAGPLQVLNQRFVAVQFRPIWVI